MPDLKEMLQRMVDSEASDLHLRAGRPPLIRVGGELRPLDESPVLEAEELQRMAESMMSDRHKAMFERDMSVDISFSLPGVSRFRVNVYKQRGTVSIVFRGISTKIPTIEDLCLPQVIKTFCHRPQGMVLVTGPTGSGKSTTLAAMIQYINESRSVHIITIEDPIEFMFADVMATVSQREIGIDTPSFAEALRNALRQDPDIILVGEMRDLETISTAITAAETGHLLFSTLHTNNAAETISRIVDVFPAHQQAQIRVQLSASLLGVISQRLLPRIDGAGRIPAVEIMINSPKIKNLIAENRISEITEEMENSVSYYRMQSMEQSLFALIANHMVRIEDAEAASTRPGQLRLLLNKYAIQRDGDELKI